VFKGDIDKFSPADLLAFLSHLHKEGVLTVVSDEQTLSFSFRQGTLVAAHSEAGDLRMLRMLAVRDTIAPDMLKYIRRGKQETGLPLYQVMENLEWLMAESVSEILEHGVDEVMLQLFLRQAGQFQFAEVQIETSPLQTARDIPGLVLDITRQVDEYRHVTGTLLPLDACCRATPAAASVNGDSAPLKYILGQAQDPTEVRRLVEEAPFTSYAIVKALESALAAGWIEAVVAPPEGAAQIAQEPAKGSFHAYRKALRAIMQAEDGPARLRALVDFCQDHFTTTLIMAAIGPHQVRCTIASSRDVRQGESALPRDLPIGLDADPTFRWVLESGQSFIGQTFRSDLLRALGQGSTPDECAIIPLGTMQGQPHVLFVSAPTESPSPDPFQLLEMLTWQLCPPRDGAPSQPPSPPAAAGEGEPQVEETGEPEASRDLWNRLVETIKELPPMPDVAARVLDMVGDPNTKMSQLAEVLSRDQTLVARIIKVSNSALYGGQKKTTSLSQALIRLGTRTIRSLVVGASTRALFPTDQTQIGLWGQSLWQHSIQCGLAARRIAKRVRYGDPEEAFVGGLLHDLGKVVILLKLPDEYRRIHRMQAGGLAGSAAERSVLGFDHAKVGKLLLKEWKLPPSLIACVRFHHLPREAGEYESLAHVIALGNQLAHACEAVDQGRGCEVGDDVVAVLERLGLSPDDLRELQDSVADDLVHSGVLD
jgi:putative nucleotidyltransferase with HDIG domain